MRPRSKWMRQMVTTLVMFGMLLGLQPNSIGQASATTPAQTRITFEPLGRIFLGRAEDVIVEHDRAYMLTENGLLIADVSQPAHPRKLGEWYLPLDLDLGITKVELAVADGRAYVPATRSRIFIVDVRDPTQPVTTNVIRSRSEFPWGITVSGSLLYVTHLYQGLQIIDVGNPAQPREVGYTLTPGAGYSVTVVGKLAYVADGRAGVQIYDVSNPRRPRRIGSVATRISAHRITVSGTVAYVADDEGGLRIIDVSDPTQPQEIAAYIPSPDELTRYRIAAAGRYVYVPFRSLLIDGFRGVRILDVSDPRQPREVGRMSAPGAYGVAVVGDVAVVADASTGLRTFDVTDRQQPQPLGVVDIITWSHDVIVRNNLAYVVDLWAGLLIVDVSNPHHPRVLSQVKITDYTRAITLIGNLAYVISVYDGLRIIDVSEPEQPKIVGAIETSGRTVGVAVSGELACVADYDYGLRVIDVSHPTHPEEIGHFEVSGAATGVAISGSLVYLTEQDSMDSFDGGKLRILDISNPRQPRQVGVIPTAGSAWSVTVIGNTAYVADLEQGLRIIDVHDPTQPKELAFMPFPPFNSNVVATEVVLTGGIAYIGGSPIHVVDVSNPQNPREIGSLVTPTNGWNLAIEADQLYVAGNSGGLCIYRIRYE